MKFIHTPKSVGEWPSSDPVPYEEFCLPVFDVEAWKEQKMLEEKLDEIIEAKVNEKVDEVLREKQTIQFRKITKTVARNEITDFIKKKHGEGIFKLSVLDVVLDLRIPASQVDEIMEEFVKKNKIKES